VLFATSLFAQDYKSRAQYEASIRYQTRMIADTNSVGTAALRDILNLAIRSTDEKARFNHKYDTIWTVAGTEIYALNSDCYEMGVVSAALFDTNLDTRRALKLIELKDRGQFKADPIVPSGEPQFVWQFGSKIGIEPVPQEVRRIEIQYEARTTAFNIVDSLSTDSITAIKPEYEYLVIDHAVFQIKKRFGQYPDAQLLYGMWLENAMMTRQTLLARPDILVSPQKERGQ